MELTNRVALITGGSKGIGRAIALHLARAGCDVAISGRTGTLLQQVAREVEDLGRKAFVFIGDMSQEDDIKTFVHATVDILGRLDILINNVGVGYFYRIAEMPTEAWDQMFQLNVRGLFLTTRESMPFLRQAGESAVINIVSLSGKNAFETGGGYAATKHAVLGFSRCLMLEERPNGVRVTAICPGSVDTPFFDTHPGGFVPNRQKILQAEDVAESVVHVLQMPQRATISELDLRPSNP